MLGAGNSNDLDLPRILDTYAEVHLVDIDEQALAEGVARQQVESATGLVLHGGVDVTDPAWQIDPADVAVSSALLTQLIDTAEQTGQTGTQLLTVRDAHLRLIARLLTPKGSGLLITDVVSSDTCTRLPAAGHHELAALMIDSINAGDFFTGTNPVAIRQRLMTDPQIRAHQVALSMPWRWQLASRSFLVCAVAFEPHV